MLPSSDGGWGRRRSSASAIGISRESTNKQLRAWAKRDWIRLDSSGQVSYISGARQRAGGVEKYSSIASRQAPEHRSTASSPGPDSSISAAIYSVQLLQSPARSIRQPVQFQLDL